MKSRSKPTILLLTLSMIALTACGIKPSQLTPEDESQKDTFPHVYPHDVTGKVKNK